jgi:hypothetical protein
MDAEGLRSLSVSIPNAQSRTRVELPDHNIDFMVFCTFLVDAVCLLHKSLDVVVTLDGPLESKREMIKGLQKELAHYAETPTNISSVTALLPSAKPGKRDTYTLLLS